MLLQWSNTSQLTQQQIHHWSLPYWKWTNTNLSLRMQRNTPKTQKNRKFVFAKNSKSHIEFSEINLSLLVIIYLFPLGSLFWRKSLVEFLLNATPDWVTIKQKLWNVQDESFSCSKIAGLVRQISCSRFIYFFIQKKKEFLSKLLPHGKVSKLPKNSKRKESIAIWLCYSRKFIKHFWRQFSHWIFSVSLKLSHVLKQK